MSHSHRSLRPGKRPPPPLVDRLLGWQTILLLVASSWAGGGKLTWTPAMMLGIAAAGLPLLFLSRRRPQARPQSVWTYLPLVLWLMLFGVALLNPSYEWATVGVWTARPGWIPWLPSTVDRFIMCKAELPWITAILQATLLVAIRPDRRVIRMIWAAVAINGFALAGVGAAFHFTQAEKMLGIWTPPERWYFFATFFYKNHWAAYGALGATAGTALALRAWRRARVGDPEARGQLLFYGAMAVLTAITLPLPGSRAGTILAVFIVVGFLATLLFTLWRDQRLSRFGRAGIAIAVGVAVLAALNYGETAYSQRRVDWARTKRQLAGWRHGEVTELRFLLSRDTWHMAKDRPVFGWGIGSYGLIFYLYQGSYLRGKDGRPNAWVAAAHDDWLQMVAEAGFVGLTILLVPVLVGIGRGWRHGGIAGRWGLLGCGAIALFAWIDFPFNNPAVLALWTVMLFTARDLGRDHENDPQPRRRASAEITEFE